MAQFMKYAPDAALKLIEPLIAEKFAARGFGANGLQKVFAEDGNVIAYEGGPDKWFVSSDYIDRQAALEAIAADMLSIETLATRNSDRLDFHDVAVWTLKAALNAAFEAGRKEGMA